MADVIYILEVELSYGVWTDISASWHTAVPLIITRGLEPGTRVAGVGSMTLALHNLTGRFIPGHPNALPGFDVGTPIRLRAGMAGGEETHTLFYGRVASISPQRGPRSAGTAGPLSVAISAGDEMAALARAPLGVFPLLLEATPGDLAGRLVRRSFVPPGCAACWRIGHPQASRIGVSTRIAGPDTGVRLDRGRSVFPWAGDGWPPDRTALAALREVCASEGGLFYLAADGTPVFAERTARAVHVEPDAVLEGRLHGLEVRREAARIANRVTVTAHPREVGTGVGLLWEAGHAVRIPPGSVRMLTAPYADPDERVAAVGALSVIPPLPGVDFTATDRADGTGKDLTHRVQVQVVAGAAAARITLRSLWVRSKAVFVHGLRLRGVPLRRYYPVSVTAADDDSRFAHGLHPLDVDLPLQSDTRTAADLARSWLRRCKDAHPWLTISIEAGAGAGLLAGALARDVGDRLHVTDAGLALDEAACFIDGLRHEVRRGGGSHRVVWHTSPAGLHTYWLIGHPLYSRIGQTTRPAV